MNRSEVVKKLSEGPEVEKREVPAPQVYWTYIEDDGFSRDDEIGSIGRFLHSLSLPRMPSRLLAGGLLLASSTAAAQSTEVVAEGGGVSIDWLLALVALAAVPLALAMLTAFLKVVVVLGILRSALGLQSVPPLPLVIGLGAVLTAVIMAPVAVEMAAAAEAAVEGVPGDEAAGPDDWTRVAAASQAALVPLSGFLARHAHAAETALFAELTGRELADAESDPLVLAPAFVISELKEAFMIGFLLLVPFLVIDLVVANVLLSLGMHMLSPTTVSLPFKLLLFVLIDGWHLLARGLVSSYQLV